MDIFLGGITKPFGIKGEVKFNPSPDFWEDTLSSQELVLRIDTESGVENRTFSIERSRPHGNVYVLKLEGVDDRNAAEAIVGAEFFLPADKIDVELPERAMPFQVIGCQMKTEAGEVVGEVAGLLFSPAHDIFEVTGKNGTILVPAVPEFVSKLDIERGEIIIKPQPGLLEDE